MTGVQPVHDPSEEPAQHNADGDQANPPRANASSERFQEAIRAARKLLIDTVEAVDPETPAEELLKVVKDYRAGLAEVVAALPVPDGGDIV